VQIQALHSLIGRESVAGIMHRLRIGSRTHQANSLGARDSISGGERVKQRRHKTKLHFHSSILLHGMHGDSMHLLVCVYTHTHSSWLHLCLKLRTKKAYKGAGGKSLFIIDFGNRFRWVFSFTAGKSTWGMLRCLSKSKRVSTCCVAVSAYFVTRYLHCGELVLEFRFTCCGQMLATSLNKPQISRRDGVAKKINPSLTGNRIQVVSVLPT